MLVVEVRGAVAMDFVGSQMVVAVDIVTLVMALKTIIVFYMLYITHLVK